MPKNFVRSRVFITSTFIAWACVIIIGIRVATHSFLSSNAKELNILIWPLTLDSLMLQEFERETGYKVRINYYDNDRELLYKLRSTSGKGYDVVIAADYLIEQLRAEGLLKEIETKKLSFFEKLNPNFLGHYFDPDNRFSVPYILLVYGLGIDRSFFGDTQPEPSWKLLFEEQDKPYEVVMTDDARTGILLTGTYLYGSPRSVRTAEQLEAITKLLIEQKKRVVAYTDIFAEQVLATGSSPVAMIYATDLWRAKKERPDLDFILPREGSCMVLESFAQLRMSSKDEATYAFLKYMYRPEILRHHIDLYGFCSPRVDVEGTDFDFVCPTYAKKDSLFFLRMAVDSTALNQAWLEVMLA